MGRVRHSGCYSFGFNLDSAYYNSMKDGTDNQIDVGGLCGALKAARMVGIIKKVNREGSGIIAVANGSKVPFVRSDVLNQQTLKPGGRVVFSLREVKGKTFAQNIEAVPR